MRASRFQIPRQLKMFLAGKPFWDLWGGRVLHAVVISSIVAFTLQIFDSGVKKFVDTTVQSTLLNQMNEMDFALPKLDCDGSTDKGATGCIMVVGIDDIDHRSIFQQQSPLNPAELQKLFDQMRIYPPRIVGIDLDLSPASETELITREALRQSLLALSRVSKVVMVCPQGYSTPEPSALDKNWVESFDSSVKFASADLDADGLYYNKHVAKNGTTVLDVQTIQALGVVVADIIKPSTDKPAVSWGTGKNTWHLACKTSALSITGKSENITQEVLRPAVVLGSSFTQALGEPGLLADRIVLVGGKWGINDRFTLRGQTDQFYGVSLHAWAVASELKPQTELPAPLMLIIDVCVGILAGIAFALIWLGVFDNKEKFALRSLFYLLFFALAIFVPLAMIAGAAHLAKLGVTLGVAGMILSSAADSVLSSHESLLEQEKAPESNGSSSYSKTQKINEVSIPFFLPRSWLIFLGLATLTSIGLFYFGEPKPTAFVQENNLIAWALLGVSFGLAIASIDVRKIQTYEEQNNFDKESNWDWTFRFIWMFIKISALLWAVKATLVEHGPETLTMLILFFVSWFLAFFALRKTRIA